MNANSIKLMRDMLDLTLEDLARQLDVSTSTVHRWEKGQCKPSPMAEKELKKLMATAIEESDE